MNFLLIFLIHFIECFYGNQHQRTISIMEDFMGHQEQAEEIELDPPRTAHLLKDDYGVYKVSVCCVCHR